MDILSKLMGGIDLESFQDMIPQKRIVDYKIVTAGNPSALESKVVELVKEGYEPIGVITYNETNGVFIKELVKNETIIPKTNGKEE